MYVSDELHELVAERDDDERIEVLFGLDEEYAVGALTDRLMDEGNIVNYAGFDIYRATVTAQRLQSLFRDEPDAIAFAERGRRATGGITN